MSEMSDEALAELLSDMEDAQRREYVETNIEVDTVAALIREVQRHRTQAREVRDAALEDVAGILAGWGPHVSVNAQAMANRIRALKSKRND